MNNDKIIFSSEVPKEEGDYKVKHGDDAQSFIITLSKGSSGELITQHGERISQWQDGFLWSYRLIPSDILAEREKRIEELEKALYDIQLYCEGDIIYNRQDITWIHDAAKNALVSKLNPNP